MTELETLMLDVTNTLNHNGFDDVQITPQSGEDFSIRVGYCNDEWFGALSSEDLNEMNTWVIENNKEMI